MRCLSKMVASVEVHIPTILSQSTARAMRHIGEYWAHRERGKSGVHEAHSANGAAVHPFF